MDFLIPRKYLIAIDQGWNGWDLEVYRGIWSKAQVDGGGREPRRHQAAAERALARSA